MGVAVGLFWLVGTRYLVGRCVVLKLEKKTHIINRGLPCSNGVVVQELVNAIDKGISVRLDFSGYHSLHVKYGNQKQTSGLSVIGP